MTSGENWLEKKFLESLMEKMHPKKETPPTFEGQYSDLAEAYANSKYENNPQQEDLNDFVGLLKSNCKVLDLGCGAGQDSKFMHEAGMEIVGIDISREMINAARKRNQGANIEFIVGDFVKNFFEDNFFDAVWCSTVFHHIPSNQNRMFIEKINRILKSGGILYISAGVGDKLQEKWTDAEWNISNKKIKTKMYNKIMKSDDFEKLISDSGFEIIKKTSNQDGDYLGIYARNNKQSAYLH